MTVKINKYDKYFTKFISQLKICQMLVHTKLARHKAIFFQRNIIINIDFPRLDFLSHDFQMRLVKRRMSLPLLMPHLQCYRKNVHIVSELTTKLTCFYTILVFSVATALFTFLLNLLLCFHSICGFVMSMAYLHSKSLYLVCKFYL